MRTSEAIVDELLILASQDGDARAFEALLSRFNPRMRRHAWRLTGNADAADDIVQEAWLAIVRGLCRLSDPASFRAWALRIVTHKAADWIRRRGRDRKLKNALESREPRSAANDFDHVSAVDTDASLRRLRKAIDDLSPEFRAVVGLHYGEGLSLADVAHVLDIPAGTVKSRLHTARDRLRKTMERNEQ